MSHKRANMSKLSESTSPLCEGEDEDEECMICMEDFDRGRKKVTCPRCEKGCCLHCFRRYLLEASSSTPECPQCHHKLSLEFVSKYTPKVFHNDIYRKKRARDLLSREKSLLPVTQQLIVNREERERRKAQIDELVDEAHYITNRLIEIRKKIVTLDSRVQTHKIKKERNTFIMGCGVPDCRGFLSQAWKCGTCGEHTCSKCRIVKNEGHECNPDDVATAKLLSSDTKSCPKCAAPIHKIEGCDQMFCPLCQTAFSWKTGKIETGVIHNPHYYQWQREQNGGVAPRPAGTRYDCGGLPWWRSIQRIMKERHTLFPKWQECHRSVNHVSRVVVRRYPRQVGVQDHTDLRIKYLLKDIDENEWANTLRRRQKKIEKNQEIHNILEMYSVTLTDMFQRYIRTNLNICREAHAIRSYVNTELRKISIRYNNMVPQINESWQEKRYK